MKTLTLIILSMITSLVTKSQGMGEIKILYVFDYFQIKGYTTAGAYTHFDDMIKQNVAKIEAKQEDCSQLNQILKGVKSKKHSQTKFGIENVFIEIKTEKCIIRAVIGIGSSFVVITDLSNYKEYWIKDNEQQKWITEFISKLKNAKKPD